MSRPVKVLGLVPYPLDTTPSQRFRLEQWKPRLGAAGIELELVPFADVDLMRDLYLRERRWASTLGMTRAWLRRLRLIASVPAFDAVVIHRAAAIVGPAWIESLLAGRGRPIVYDFDDSIFLLHTTASNRRFGWLKFPGKTETNCRLSRHVVTGNEYLAEYARRFNPRVTVVPTSIDTESYQPRQSGGAGRVVVGWAGSATSQSHLESFAPVLRDAARSWDFELRVLSDQPPRLDGLAHVWTQWSPDITHEVEALSRFDIGIMPMPDDEWSRGKCGLKALQYMAVGAATVCSPVGMNRELIRHGENGMLASNAEEWVACLGSLAADRALRERLGRAGRQTVERNFSASRSAARFAGVICEALGR